MSGNWYKKGFKEAVAGTLADPPWESGHRDYENYMDGYRDGQKWAEPKIESENNESRHS